MSPTDFTKAHLIVLQVDDCTMRSCLTDTKKIYRLFSWDRSRSDWWI